MDAQFKKGVLEMCVLVLLQHKDRYGYEMIQLISKKMEISEGAILSSFTSFNERRIFYNLFKKIKGRTIKEVLSHDTRREEENKTVS